MPERKSTVTVLGRDVDVTEVPINEISEKPNEYALEDGRVWSYGAL